MNEYVNKYDPTLWKCNVLCPCDPDEQQQLFFGGPQKSPVCAMIHFYK